MGLKSLFSLGLINIIPVLLLLLSFLFFIYKFGVSKPEKYLVKRLPPGPWKLPVIGSLLHMVAGPLPHRTLKNLASKHGPLMHLQLGQISTIVVSSPRVAKEVMKTHDLALASRPKILASEIIAYNNSDIVFAPYGDYWRQMRKICTLELLSAKKVRSFSSIREEEVHNLIESVNSSSSTLDLTENVLTLTNNIVCRSAFGDRCKADRDTFMKSVREAIPLAGGFDVSDLFPSYKLLHVICGTRPKLEKLHHNIDQIMENIINERVSEKGNSASSDHVGDQEDLLDVLLRLKGSGGLEFPITHTNVKAVIFDMFSAGTETSSTTIDWAMAEMMRNPRVIKKAQVELRQVLKGKQVVGESDIKEIGYLKLVIKETLRLHPPAPLLIPRECREECEIDGYTIPVKTKVMVNTWAIGTDPEYWKDAESFYPERFENSDIDFMGSNFEFIPFGAGRRICPGMNFGLANVELPLANLLYHFNWKLPNGMKPEDLDMSESFGITVKRKNNLNVIATCHTHLTATC